MPGRLNTRLDSKLSSRSWTNSGYLSNYFIPSWVTKDFLKTIDYKLFDKAKKMYYQKNIKSYMQNYDSADILLRNSCVWLNQNINQTLDINRVYPYRDESILKYLFSLNYKTKYEIGARKKILTDSSILPKEISQNPDRSQTAFIFNNGINKEWEKFYSLVENSYLVSLGWFHKNKFIESLMRYKLGFNEEFIPLMRALTLEVWFQYNKIK